jgi:cell division transport system permease protein
MRMTSFRSVRFDELGLRRALTDRIVPSLAAAMAFLAALAIAGWMGTAVLVRHWETGANSTLTVQVPRAGDPDATGSLTRLNAVHALLVSTPGVTSAETLSDEQLNTLLRPWLGADIKNLSIPVPAVIAVHVTGAGQDLSDLESQMAGKAPGTILDDHAAWAGRLSALAHSLRLYSGLVLLIVTLVTAAVIAMVMRSALAARRNAILVVYQLGATEGYITHRLSNRTAALASIGGAIGGLFALPVVFTLTTLVAPIGGPGSPAGYAAFALLPSQFWLLPVIPPAAASAIGYLTAQITMRRWLRRLP